MRYYIGVDWADTEHAVWVEDEEGAKVLSRSLAQTPEAFAEWGRWLDERRAEGLELWAAIEKPDGRVVDFLLDQGVVVFPVNPKGAGSCPGPVSDERGQERSLRCPGLGRLSTDGSRPPAALAAQLRGRAGTEGADPGLCAASPAADAAAQPADGHAEGILSPGSRDL